MEFNNPDIYCFVCCLLASETCADGIQNQGEDGIDCGGPCSPCGKKLLY